MSFIRTLFVAGLLVLEAASAQAVELTDLPGVTATANGCYQGCGNATHDASNILDGDYGATGNTGLNSWNYGSYGGWVQINLDQVYQLDRIELYGVYSYYNPFTLSVSADGLTWTTVAISGYGVTPDLAHTGVSGIKYGAVFDIANNSMASGLSGQYIRYTVNGGSPHWGYLAEMDVQGHLAAVPEPESYAMLIAGLGLVAAATRRRKES